MRKFPWLKLIVLLAGLIPLLSLIWFAGPLASLGGYDPLDSSAARGATMITVSAGGVAYFIYEMRQRWKGMAAIAGELTGGAFSGGGGEKDGASGERGAAAPVKDDSDTLKLRMTDALATLRKASGGKGDYLYDLPWYVIIGPPGSGKTTALVNSGLKFPLSRSGVTPESVAGEGGTRYCDWWFTEDAVLVDTAGRYTTQDSNSAADRGSWVAFLQLLGKNRPKQPINGVLICISVEDILKLPKDELRKHADAIRSRLIELHDELKVDFPVYAVFTKADLISGFMEFFGPLNERQRSEVWGATFQTDDKTANMVGEAAQEFDLLVQRLNQDVLDRMQEEPSPATRVQLLGFPSQISALKRPIVDFLTLVFEPTRYHANATLRGFYFASGTQRGTPIDQLVGALVSGFGAQDVSGVQYSGLGKSFFLSRLLQDVVFGESGWVSTNVKAVRRNFLLKTVAYSLLALVVAGLLSGWWISYRRNSTLIGSEFAAITKYKSDAGALPDQSKISDNDYLQLVKPLYALRNLPAGYADRDAATPFLNTLGLDQKPRLNVSAEADYDQGLQRLLRPRVMFQLEDELRHKLDQPAALPQTLRVYMMISGQDPVDESLANGWWKRNLEKLAPGAANEAARAELELDFARLLKLDAPQGDFGVPVDALLVRKAQDAIARLSVADRAYELLVEASAAQPDRDWMAARKGGQDVSLVFESDKGPNLDAVRVPFLYTRAGFDAAFLAQLDDVTAKVREERKILGDVGSQTPLEQQYKELPLNLYKRYEIEFPAAWKAALGHLRIKPLTADKPSYLALRALAAPTSPITQLISSIADETALSKPIKAEKAADAGGSEAKPAAPKTAPAPAPHLILPSGEAPGASIEAGFRNYGLLVETGGGHRPVDDLMGDMDAIYKALTLMHDPVEAARGKQQFADAVTSLQATSVRFPDPFKALLQNAMASFDSDATGTTLARINQGVTNQITGPCKEMTAGYFPFVPTSDRDISVEQFTKLFGPDGMLDRFFTANLAQYANTSGTDWTWIPSDPVARQLSPAMLQSFQRAAEIKQAFFPNGAAGFGFSVKNLALGQNVDHAELDVNSAQMITDRPGSTGGGGIGGLLGGAPPPGPPPPPTAMQWPGPVGLGGGELKLFQNGNPQVADIQERGAWGIFRMIAKAQVAKQGQALVVTFSKGGRAAQYQINPLTLPNPFTLTSLTTFSCPVAK